ncbi:MAG: type II secretion system protein [Chloroflexi bacterium]|nr:type II secretion system protein [Chloroflexota bacterium]
MKQKGFTLIEVIVALALMAMIISIFTSSMMAGRNGSRYIAREKEALELAQCNLSYAITSPTNVTPQNVTGLYYYVLSNTSDQVKLIANSTISGTFSVNDLVIGLTSNAAGYVLTPNNSNVTARQDNIILRQVSGNFLVNETAVKAGGSPSMAVSDVAGPFDQYEAVSTQPPGGSGFIADSYRTYAKVFCTSGSFAQGQQLKGLTSGAYIYVGSLQGGRPYVIIISAAQDFGSYDTVDSPKRYVLSGYRVDK